MNWRIFTAVLCSSFFCLILNGVLISVLGLSFLTNLISILMGACIVFIAYKYLKNNLTETDETRDSIDQLLNGETDKAAKHLGAEFVEGFKKSLKELFVSEYQRIRDEEIRKMPKSIRVNQMLEGLRYSLEGDHQDADAIFNTGVSNEIQSIIAQYINKQGLVKQSELNQNRSSQQQINTLINDLEKLVYSVLESTKNVAQANRIAHEAGAIASTNKDVVDNAAESMSTISKSSAEISKIIKSIDNIAFQTNLLALNASVEAARAGKAGAGFNVVATEVKNLAGRATEAAQSTQELISDVVGQIQQSETKVQQSTSAFNDLTNKAKQIESLVDDFQVTSQFQSHEIERIHVSLMQQFTHLENGDNKKQELVPVRGPEIMKNQTLTIQTHWLPQAQFAGYYMAVEMGLYHEMELNVKLLDGGPDFNPLFGLVRGEIHFGTAWLSSVLITIARGADVLMLAQVFQKSGLLLIALKSSGIRTIKDLSKKIISSWGGIFIYPIMALDEEHDLNLQHVYMGADIDSLKSGEVDVLTVMSYNELFTLYDAGIDKQNLVIFPIADFGYNIPEDGLYTSREFQQKEPEICQRFTQASLKGWQLASENREEALEIVLSHHKRSSMQTSKKHQERMLDEVLNLVGNIGQHNGILDRSDFDKTIKVLNQIKQIKQEIHISDFFAR